MQVQTTTQTNIACHRIRAISLHLNRKMNVGLGMTRQRMGFGQNVGWFVDFTITEKHGKNKLRKSTEPRSMMQCVLGRVWVRVDGTAWVVK